MSALSFRTRAFTLVGVAAIGLTALPGVYFEWLIMILLGYVILVQFVKTWFIRKFGYN